MHDALLTTYFVQASGARRDQCGRRGRGQEGQAGRRSRSGGVALGGGQEALPQAGRETRRRSRGSYMIPSAPPHHTLTRIAARVDSTRRRRSRRLPRKRQRLQRRAYPRRSGQTRKIDSGEATGSARWVFHRGSEDKSEQGRCQRQGQGQRGCQREEAEGASVGLDLMRDAVLIFSIAGGREGVWVNKEGTDSEVVCICSFGLSLAVHFRLVSVWSVVLVSRAVF